MYLVAAERQGVAVARAERHAADRHLQGVHRAEGVALPAGAAPAADRRPDGVLHRADAGLQAAVGVRVPHPGGRLDGRAGTGVHAGRRLRLRRAGAVPRAWTSTDSRPGCRFFFDAHIDFFEEIAKFRAARRIWARWMRDVYGATDPRAQWLRFHTQTAGVSLTAQQPDNNVVRTAVEALAAVLGGTNSLHTNALDEVLALPTEKSAQIALRTQQVIMEETGVLNVADPLGGSWYVEALTDRIEAEAEHIFTRIRELAALAVPSGEHPIGEMTSGHPARHRGRLLHRRDRRRRLRLRARRREGREEDGRRQLPDVGGVGEDLEILRISGDVETEQTAVLARRRAARDDALVRTALHETGRGRPRRRQSRAADAATPCARRRRSGEICDALRDLWGVYTEPARI